MRTKNTGLPIALSMLFLALAGCAPTVTVTTDYDRSADLTKYTSYGFYEETPSSQRHTGNLSTSLDTYMRSAIRTTMNDQGLQYSATGPDLKVAYDVSVDKELYVNTNYVYPPGFGYGYGYWYGYRYNYGFNRFPATYKTIDQYKEGTVVIDLIEAGSNELVWRGVGEAAVDMTGDISQDRINTIVNDVLEEFPPKK